MKLGEVEVGKNERPIHPPIIKSVEVIDNPFPDIVPRITSVQRKEQVKARKEAKKEKQKEKMLAKHKALAKLRLVSAYHLASHAGVSSARPHIRQART
jgi:peptidyl-prolyl cis-trans isomerase SDCCAG10